MGLKAGDALAFRQLVVTYQHPIYGLALRMLGQPAEAEDAAQEIFFAVCQHIRSFRNQSRLSTWLYRIAINHCRNRRRKLAGMRAQVSGCSAEVQREQPHGAVRPDCQLETRQLADQIQQALLQIDQDQQILLVLRDIQGLSYDEIGAITELPLGTVKSRLHRARSALKEQLERLQLEVEQ